MKRYLLIPLVLLAGAVGASAQDPAPKVERKLVKLDHVRGDQVTGLLVWIRHYQSPLGVILLEGTAEDIAKAEEIVRNVDRPWAKEESPFRGSVELDAYFVAGGSEPMGGSIPPLVAPAVAELRQRFPYTSYGLLDSVLVQASVGAQAEVHGEFARAQEEPVWYRLKFKPSGVTDSPAGRAVWLTNLVSHWRIPDTKLVPQKDTGNPVPVTHFRETQIETDVSIPEGRLVVVGKAGSPTGAEAIFLVLHARLLE